MLKTFRAALDFCIQKKINKMNTIDKPHQSQQIRVATIKRIAGFATAAAALLETFDMVPTTGQADILAVASSIANDVARDLASLIGGGQ